MKQIKITTPVAPLWLCEQAGKLVAIDFFEPSLIAEIKETPVLLEAKQQLLAYFDGQLTAFDLPLHFLKGTPFQQQVWHTLLTIPYGESWSYQQVAEAIDNPKAVRAVGQANRKNPLPIVVPCHRVIGKDGQLTGYMGKDGLAIKKQLLLLEGLLPK